MAARNWCIAGSRARGPDCSQTTPQLLTPYLGISDCEESQYLVDRQKLVYCWLTQEVVGTRSLSLCAGRRIFSVINKCLIRAAYCRIIRGSGGCGLGLCQSNPGARLECGRKCRARFRTSTFKLPANREIGGSIHCGWC